MKVLKHLGKLRLKQEKIPASIIKKGGIRNWINKHGISSITNYPGLNDEKQTAVRQSFTLKEWLFAIQSMKVLRLKIAHHIN
ncbi:hypothetical protein [Methylobacter marinus]|uniref:hypothetical protein n=1 Tax=Methylobacter marinus TaxID=34058 RepID=UPI00039EB20D|nr:hypothetical protein [Methylobacter marinus]